MTMRGPLNVYRSMLLSKTIKENNFQLEAITKLQELHDKLSKYDPPIPKQLIAKTGESKLNSPDFSWIDKEKSIFSLESLGFSKSYLSRGWSSVFGLSTTSNKSYGPQGMYIYGGVGTGKSMIMDLFYGTMQVERKKRTHFHQFMQDIHKQVHQLKMKGITSDPIPAISAHLAADAWLLCFDELQVTNIVDAMLLRRLLGELMDLGVVMVTTSNRHPDHLYQNGIQRQSFLPTIALLKERCLVYNLDGELDYRKREQGRNQVFFRTGNDKTRTLVTEIMKILANGAPATPKKLEIWGREFTFPETRGKIARTSFRHLCGEARSAAEYLEIAKTFNILIVEDIPKLSLDTRDEARRFITLIDALYDHKVKLIASFESNLADLFTGETSASKIDRTLVDDLNLNEQEVKSSIFSGQEEIFAFQRALSRLMEMRGTSWWPEYPTLIDPKMLP